MLGEEKKWYENDTRSLFGVILWDYTDKDYNAVLLMRDEDSQIRSVDVQHSFSTIEVAEKWIEITSKKYDKSGRNKKGEQLFIPLIDRTRLHPYFDILNTMPTHIGAKTLISEIIPHFFDIDGNFIEQFQTNGFDARLWELFLLCYFNEEYLQIDRKYSSPDFLLSDGETDISLEAVTVARKTPLSPFDGNIYHKLKVNVADETKNAMPLRYGSSLHSKLTYKPKGSGLHYWEYPHTQEKPFVLAIADFHEDFSMTWSTTALIEFLYGFHYSHVYDDGKLIVTPEKIDSYEKSNGEKISAGFFFSPEVENISAILHTTSGTLSKFNRIGKQCGFDENNTQMLRMLAMHNHDKNASEPHYVQYLVNEDCEETWGEGISIYHNPNAKYPLPKDFSLLQHNIY